MNLQVWGNGVVRPCKRQQEQQQEQEEDSSGIVVVVLVVAFEIRPYQSRF